MSNLVQFKDLQVATEVGKDIEIIIESLSINSENTSNSYRKDIEDFFMFMRGKEIKDLTIDDLIFKNNQIQEYQNRLAKDLNNGNPYAFSSINHKISVLRTLYGKLEANDYDVKSAWFNVVVAKGEANSWESVSWDIVLQMINYVKDTKLGDIKSLLIETAVVTSFRKSELLNLTWNDLSNVDGVWVLTTIGKGNKKNVKPITQKLYDRLIQLRTISCDKIFKISDKSVKNMMVKLRQELGLDERVTFHSLKKCGINEVYLITGGDIMAVAKQGNHSSFGTTMKHYMDSKQDFKSSPNLQIGKDDEIMEKLNELTKEELIEAITKASRATKYDLMHQVQLTVE